MCYFIELSKPVQELQKHFNAKFENPEKYKTGVFNGFQHPQSPVIIHKQPNIIKLLNWGLIPHWAKDDNFRKNTLNARMESIHEKSSFRDVVNNRCLIVADGFFEWQWLDAKGKQKQKYELTLPDKQVFGFAGLWSQWADRSTGETRLTYTILTTEANELMAKIHNTQKRMPVIVEPAYEHNWLQDGTLVLANDKLVATTDALNLSLGL